MVEKSIKILVNKNYETAAKRKEWNMIPNLIDQFRIEGKVVVVTGASRGIGEGIAIGLADAGAAVILTVLWLLGVTSSTKKVDLGLFFVL